MPQQIMFDTLIRLVFGIGVLGILFGIGGDYRLLTPASILVAGALIAAAVRFSRPQE